MKLLVNNIEKNFAEGITLQELIQQLQVSDKVMALAVNMEVIKSEKWESYTPKDGDEIELLNFVGGG